MTTKILLMGKTGQGKSTLGNFLLDRKEFKAMPGLAAVTGVAAKADGELRGLSSSVRIIDTPGLADAFNAKEDLMGDDEGIGELAKGIQLATEDDGGKPGVDILLYVIRAGDRFSRDQALILKYFEDQGHFWDHAIVVFSKAREIGDDEKAQRSYLEKQKLALRCPEALKKLLDRSSGKNILIEACDTSSPYRDQKLEEIVQLMKTIMKRNDGRRYTTELMMKVIENPNLDTKEAVKEEVKKAGGSCFPGDATVFSKDGTKLMKDLKIGDKVLCNNTDFSEVIAFLHYQPTEIAVYLTLDTEQGSSITISANHLVFTAISPESSSMKVQPLLAGEIKEGDSLIVCDEQNQPATSQVTKIHTVQKQGVYAPLTRSGVIVVDGVMASCYASFHSHDLAHVAFAPLRLYSSISKGPPQPKEGIHGYAMSLYKTVKFFSPHSIIH